ncbi:MAG: methyltransferase, partial [Solimonas sp.]
MTDPAPAAAAGGDYNLVPYVSKPFPQSQPPRLAALAALFGLSAPAVSQCQMLELGCASGGNLIPLALRFPASRFRGVDLTDRHVRHGQARIAALDLRNVRIEQGDIATLDLGIERFDYIVCHGVYSWVPPEVRDAILRIAAEHLAHNGVAYVSYNVFPGWHLRGVIRDMMVY